MTEKNIMVDKSEPLAGICRKWAADYLRRDHTENGGFFNGLAMAFDKGIIVNEGALEFFRDTAKVNLESFPRNDPRTLEPLVVLHKMEKLGLRSVVDLADYHINEEEASEMLRDILGDD